MKISYFFMYIMLLMTSIISTALYSAEQPTESEHLGTMILEIDDTLPLVIQDMIFALNYDYTTNTFKRNLSWFNNNIASIKGARAFHEHTFATKMMLMYFMYMYNANINIFPFPPGSAAYKIYQSLHKCEQTFLKQLMTTIPPQHTCRVDQPFCLNHLSCSATVLDDDQQPIYPQPLTNEPFAVNDYGDLLISQQGLIDQLSFIVHMSYTGKKRFLSLPCDQNEDMFAWWCNNESALFTAIKIAYGTQDHTITIVVAEPATSKILMTGSTHEKTITNYEWLLPTFLYDTRHSKKIHALYDRSKKMVSLIKKITDAYYQPDVFLEVLPNEAPENNLKISYISSRHEPPAPWLPASPAYHTRDRSYTDNIITLSQSGKIISPEHVAQSIPRALLPLLQRWPILWSPNQNYACIPAYRPLSSHVAWGLVKLKKVQDEEKKMCLTS